MKEFEFMYEDDDTGEVFSVIAQRRGEATKIAKRYFKEPHFIRVLEEGEGDMLGIDAYD